MTFQIVQKKFQNGSLLDRVMAYEHPELVDRLKHKLNLTEAEADQLFADTKRYLYLCAVSNEPLAPSAAIYKGWHEFLMYTKEYQEFCNFYFGKMVHHAPNPTLRPYTVLNVSDTSAVAAQHFGSLSSNWFASAAECDSSSCSSKCSGTGPTD